MSQLELRPIKVATGSDDETGLLVLVDDRLCAVIVRLDGSFNEGAQGHWHVEAGFGPVDSQPNSFGDLGQALRWIGRRTGLTSVEIGQADLTDTDMVA